ncbi:MAG: T9SS type A sorting domain-containing protein [Melioribacteraceae bacterium]|nr:T9SS type A sorting domain-containing protein [Melioribacteraceae bacterium]
MQKHIFTILLLLLFATTTFSQVVVTNDITGNVTWTSDNEYILDGLIFVDTLSTLTIESGTVVKGKLQSNITTGDGASALIVRRGAQIFAEGTPESPIIFTSELDDVTIPDDLLMTDRALWGGVIILGEAVTNQPTDENQIEGIPNTFNARYGGSDDNDNSGVVRYVSIRHGGFSISGVPGDEVNGLTMGAVGDQTTIEYIEVFANFDDGYEWFGGTVNTRYLAAIMCGDDAFDYDQGWRGKNQFWFALAGDDEAGRGGEHDGGDDDETGQPYAIPMVSNATWIGSGASSAGVGGDGNDRAIYFRDNAGGKYYNSIFTDYVGVGLKVEDIDGQDSRKQMEDGNLVLSNNIWFGFGAGSDLLTIASGDQWAADHLAANGNQIVDPQLRGISRTNDDGLDPRPQSGITFESVGDSFFADVDYVGAFNPADGLWTEGWTAASFYGLTASTVVDVEEENEGSVPASFDLSQNYPNPFNPSTKIKFAIPQASDVKLSIYNVLGQKVAELINGFRAAGTYTVDWNAEQLSSGLYIYRLEAGSNVISKKMTLLK